MQLNKIQDRFKNLMLDPTATKDMDAVFESGRIPLEDRLSIYRSNIIGSLSDVLRAGYPLIEALVGEEFMKGMARHFVINHPPQGGCLNHYGAEFPNFLSAFKPAAALPYLPDVARFEWAKQDAYYAADDQPLKVEELASIPTETLGGRIIALRDSVHLISSSYPLLAIEAFCAREDKNDDETLDLDQGGATVMIYRPALKVETLALEPAAFSMLTALQSKTPLGAALETITASHDNFNFQAFLQSHVALETFLTLSPNIISDR